MWVVPACAETINEPSWATMLTGSPPARVLSMKEGLPKESFGGVGLGHETEAELATPLASGSTARNRAGTSKRRMRMRKRPPFDRVRGNFALIGPIPCRNADG